MLKKQIIKRKNTNNNAPHLFGCWAIVVLTLLVQFHLKAQDLPSSQYYYNMVHLNPGYAGTARGMRINFFHRTQWISYGGGFHSSGFAFDQSLPNNNSGWGIKLTNDINGTIISPSVDVIYSYKVKLTPKISASMGLQAGIVQKYQNIGGLSGLENENLSGGFKKIYPDFALGAVIFRENLYGGISIDHITRPFQGTQHNASGRMAMLYQLSFGYIKYYRTSLLSQKRAISPNFILMMQGLETSLTWGANYQYDALVGGVWIRHNLQPKINSLIFSLGYKTKSSRFAYSYDIALGMKTVKPGGTHEISYTQLFDIKKKKKKKPIECPSFLL